MPEALGDKFLRGAMLGTGSISLHHMRSWIAIPNLKIVALANRTRERALVMGREFGVDDAHIYSDYRDLLEKEKPDFVDVATAPTIHREQVIAAAQHGVHVLCQKPFATALEDAQAMIAACDQAGVACVVHENWRWRRWFREIKSLLDQGAIGKPRYARFHSHAADALPRPDGGLPALLTRQPYTPSMTRFILLEWGLHVIDVMRFLFGEMDSIYARMSRVSPLVAGEDMAVVTLVFKSGATAVIDISWGTYTPEGRHTVRGSVDPFVVEGDKGVIELAPRHEDDTITITTAAGSETRSVRPGLTRSDVYQESYTNTFTDFVRSLRTGEPAENEAHDNLKCLLATFAAYDSAERNQVVIL